MPEHDCKVLYSGKHDNSVMGVSTSLIRDLALARGIPVIVNIHNVDLARRFASLIVGMSGGRIVFDALPNRLRDADLAAIYGDHELHVPQVELVIEFISGRIPPVLLAAPRALRSHTRGH